MPRYYYSNKLDAESIANAMGVDDEDKERIKKDIRKNHPFSHPDRRQLVAKDGAVYVRKPGLYCRLDEKGDAIPELVPFAPGSISFGLPGYGFFVVPPGGHVDIDFTVPESAVKSAAPHLLTEAEYLSQQALNQQSQPEAKPRSSK